MAAPVTYSSAVAASMPSRKTSHRLSRTGMVASRMMTAPVP